MKNYRKILAVPVGLVCLTGVACSHSHHKDDRVYRDDHPVYGETREEDVYYDERGQEIRDPVVLQRVRYYNEPDQIVVRDGTYYYRGQPVRDENEIRAMRLAQIHAQNRQIKDQRLTKDRDEKQKREELDRAEKQKREELDRAEKQKREEADRDEKQKREELDRAEKQKAEVKAKEEHDAKEVKDREIKDREAKEKAAADAKEAERRRAEQQQQQDQQQQPQAPR